MRRLSPKHYIFYMILPMICVGFILGVGYLAILKTGELLSPDDIAKKQIQHHSRYGAGVQSLAFQHKLSLYKNIKPKIVTMGSSRAMQFQQRAFSVPFVNMGGATSGPQEGAALAEAMFDIHKPDLVLLTVDFWWLNGRYAEPVSQLHHNRYLKKSPITLDILLKPWVWMFEKKVSPAEFIFLLRNAHKDIGASAILRQDGVDQYGTHYYTSITRGTRPHEDVLFAKTKRGIHANKKIYAAGDDLSEEKIHNMEIFFRIFKKHDVPVIVILPPMSDFALREMADDGGFSYVQDVQDWLKKNTSFFYDYHDPKTLHTTDCEFVDGHHGGAILYMRMLNAMAQDTHTSLKTMLNIETIQNIIAENEGYATYPTDGEIDFLQLGCARAKTNK